MAVDRPILHSVNLLYILLFVLPYLIDGLGRQEYAWIETYEGLSQMWNADTENCMDSNTITAGCTASCFSTTTCRGIHHDPDGGTCHLLYDTTDVPENRRSNYNTTTLNADGMKTTLLKVIHKCKTIELCFNGGFCDNYMCNCSNTDHHGPRCETGVRQVSVHYRCNCSNTDHLGPRCETGGDLWSPPTGWNTLHPTLHLNLDDQSPYTLHGGATHISTQNGMGFKTNGYPHWVDLGDVSADTCFSNLSSCEEGTTMFAYIKIIAADNGHFSTYVTSMTKWPVRYGVGFFGISNMLGFQLRDRNKNYETTIPAGENPTYPTGWLRIMLIYIVDTGVELYIENVLKLSDYEPNTVDAGSHVNGHIVLGRHYVDEPEAGQKYGRAETDYLTFWDKPLSKEERDLLHQY